MTQQWKLVRVNAAFDSLMFWLDRCERKGHLDNCSDLIEPWEAFDYEDVEETPPASAQDDAKDERQAFEAWAKNKKMPLARIGEQYDDFWVDHAWNGWQARASVAAPAAGDARDAARYRTVRQSVTDEANGADQIGAAGEAIGLRPGAYPTPEQFDAMIDHIAASQQQEG